jgi:hypothetical protein
MGGLLRMRTFVNAIERVPHAEERAQGASRSTHNRIAAIEGSFRFTRRQAQAG